MADQEFWATWMARLLCTKQEFSRTLSINTMVELYWKDWPEDALFDEVRWREEIEEFLTDALNMGILEGFNDTKTTILDTVKFSPKAAVEAMLSNSAYTHLLPPSLIAAFSEPNALTASTRSGVAGRPTSASLIIAEFDRRWSRGERHPKRVGGENLKEWSRCLREWLTVAHPTSPQVGEKAIENRLRGHIRKAEALAPKTEP